MMQDRQPRRIHIRINDARTFLLILIGGVCLGLYLAIRAMAPAKQEPPPPDADGIPHVVDPVSEEIHDATGYQPDREGTDAFLATLDKPTLAEAAPHLLGAGPQDGDPVLLYRALLEAKPGWKVGKQGIGDCCSWGWCHAADVLLAVEMKLGETGTWKQAATEASYGLMRVEAAGKSSGGWGDGSYGGAAAKAAKNFGYLFRQPYPGVDLTLYSAERAKNWGNYGCGGQGDDGRLDALAKEHPIKTVALVGTYDEAAAAIANGFPVPVCSGQGFSSTRDSDGFARAQGSWSHCMCFIGVRYGNRPGLLCLNSWGTSWITGPKFPPDQPDGSFWVEKSVAAKMLSGRDSFAVSAYVGFPRRKLKHSEGW